MAGRERRRGRFSAGWSAIGLAALALILAAPASAGAALLDGKTRIRDVDALSIQKGRDRGSVLIWVRVTHARPSLDAQSRASSDATHQGRAVVTVRGERQSTRLLYLPPVALTAVLDSGHLDYAYSLRIKPGKVRKLGIGSDRRLPLGVKTIQRLDLDGDGEAEAARSDTDRARVRQTRIARAIVPPPGRYVFDAQGPPGGRIEMEVGAGTVVGVLGGYGQGPGQCFVQSAAGVTAPIDPATGGFSFHDPGPREPITLSGTFDDSSATASGEATGRDLNSQPCPTLPVPSGSVFSGP